MTMKKITVPFTAALHLFLMEAGYTYIKILGVPEESAKTVEASKCIFALQPLYTEQGYAAERAEKAFIDFITADEVYEMAFGDAYFDFVIELPVAEYERFLKT